MYPHLSKRSILGLIVIVTCVLFGGTLESVAVTHDGNYLWLQTILFTCFIAAFILGSKYFSSNDD